MKKKYYFFCMALGCLILMSSDFYYPVFYSYTRSVTCTEGSNARFDAKVKGKPAPAIEARFKNMYLDWECMVYYNKQLVPKYQSQYYNETYSLGILDVRTENEGEYSITAFNDEGSSTIRMDLKVMSDN